VAGIAVLTLAIVAGVLFAVGVNKNAQITDLRVRGVPVVVTVTRCIGLVSGSGSNNAGYACWGVYTLDGHRHARAIPGDALHVPGAKLRGVTTRDDPGLLSTAALVATERPSWTVFAVPTVLLLVDVLAIGGLLLRRRRARRDA
jgi:hypothetical protein